MRGLFVFVMDTLIAFGSAIKTLSDDGDTLKIGGHLVLFGGPDAHDATPNRDYFTKSTDFDLPAEGGQSTVYYHHGLNPALKARPLGRATLRIDDAGVWMEAELKARDAYETKILEMVRRGKLGLSSGTAVHLVERAAKSNSDGARVHEITRWPLGLDASLTPTPGEPRTMATAMKMIGELEGWADELNEGELKFDKNQPRDDNGQWTDGGGSGGGRPFALTTSFPGSEYERQQRGEHKEEMSKGDAQAELAAAKEEHRKVREANKAHRQKVIQLSLDMRTGIDRPDGQAIADESMRLYNAENSAKARLSIAKNRVERMKGEKKYLDNDESDTHELPLLDGLKLDEHPQKLLVATGDLIDRFDGWFSKRAGDRNANYVMPQSKIDSLKSLASGLEEQAAEARAIAERYEFKGEVQGEAKSEEEAKADPADVSAAVTAYIGLEARLTGVAA